MQIMLPESARWQPLVFDTVFGPVGQRDVSVLSLCVPTPLHTTALRTSIDRTIEFRINTRKLIRQRRHLHGHLDCEALQGVSLSLSVCEFFKAKFV